MAKVIKIEKDPFLKVVKFDDGSIHTYPTRHGLRYYDWKFSESRDTAINGTRLRHFIEDYGNHDNSNFPSVCCGYSTIAQTARIECMSVYEDGNVYFNISYKRGDETMYEVIPFDILVHKQGNNGFVIPAEHYFDGNETYELHPDIFITTNDIWLAIQLALTSVKMCRN